MTHYTLNTGHTRQSPRSEVGPGVTERLRPLLSDGWHHMPIPGYRLKVSTEGAGLVASVEAQGERPVITLGVAPDDETAEAIWPELERLYYSVTELPGLRGADFAVAKQPESPPWCAAIVILATPDEGRWLGDFERCLAWAWLEGLDRGE